MGITRGTGSNSGTRHTLHYNAKVLYTQYVLTLHSTIDTTKNILKWGGIFLCLLFFFVILFRFIFAVKEHFFPTPAPPPTVVFGKLPDIIFPPNASSLTFSYTLDTIDGSLPIFSDRANVYPINQPQPNLLSLQRANENVSQVGFSGIGIQNSPELYEWQMPGDITKTLSYDIVTNNFMLTSNYLDKNNPYDSQLTNKAVGTATDFFTKLGAPLTDIDNAKTTVTQLNIQNGAPVPAISIATTQIARVDFFQSNIGKLPILYVHPPFSTIYALANSATFDGQVVEARNTHKDVLTADMATYPIITAQEAYAQLREGKAYIAAYYGKTNAISIKKIYLAYYMSPEEQRYLLPIVVFEGNDGFFAYLNAIKNIWITSP